MKESIVGYIVFTLLGLVLISNVSVLAGAPREEAGRRRERVENGLRMQYAIEGLSEYERAFGIEERMAYHKVPGLSIAVINDGEIEWAAGYGEVESGSGRMVDTETLFQVASIGKPVAAAAVLRLFERDVLALDRSVNAYLSSWEIPGNEFTHESPVTLEMLLSHTGGVTVHGFPGYARGSSLPSLRQILDGMPPCNTPPIRVDIEPGTQWRYSGGGFVIVQQVLEDALGMPFEHSMRDLLFEPLEMRRTFYYAELPGDLEGNAAYAYLADGSPVAGGYHLYPEYGAGAGLWSTPSDLARFAIAVQNSYMGEPGSILSAETARDMLERRGGPMGLGFAIMSESGEVVFTHTGGNLGYRNVLVAYAATGKGAVIMTSSDAGGDICNEILRAVALVYDWPDYRPEKKVIADLTPEEVGAVAGQYDIPGFGPVPLWVEDGNLFAPNPQVEGGRILLLPESPVKFFSPSAGWLLEFLIDESGGVAGVDILIDGMQIRGTRIR